jgi:hypothetical protein
VNQSDQLDKFAAAMAKVQAEIGGAIKGSVNPAFKSKYADLSAVFEAWQSVGPANGFAAMQFPGIYDPEAKTMGMDTLVTHSSGQWVRGSMSIPLVKVDPQGYGSAVTYARRYALSAAVGICPEDDDGNLASRPSSGAPAHDRNGQRAAERDAPFPQGPCKNKTELKAKGRTFWAEVTDCTDPDVLGPLLSSHQDLQKQIADALPEWWTGGTRDGGERYDGLATVIANKQTELAANAEWKDNPMSAG